MSEGHGLTISRPSPRTILVEWEDSGPRTFLLRSDAHCDNRQCDDGMELGHLHEAKRRGAGILDFGDLFDLMGGKWDRRSSPKHARPEFGGMDYLDAVEGFALERYQPFAPWWILMSPGNHECHDDQTEVLTESGWVRFAEYAGARVATVHPLTHEAEWHYPSRLHDYLFDGELVAWRGRGYDIRVTPNHRMYYLPQRTDLWRFKEADDLASTATSRVKLPFGASSGNPDLPGVTDDELRVFGWLLTDGSIRRGGLEMAIYQSKPETTIVIRELLERAGIEFTERCRRRDQKSVAGRELVSDALPQTTFYLRRASARVLRGRLPEKKVQFWMHELSDRQIGVFLEALILGDGTKGKKRWSSAGLYGTHEMLSDFQALLVTHGWKAHLTEYRDGCWVLRITDRIVGTVASSASRERYRGRVYCMTVPNGLLITRRNGKVVVSGNSEFRKRHELDPTLRLVTRLNERTGSSIQRGPYAGWVVFRCRLKSRVYHTLKMRYIHGYGGGGPVTKGVIQTARRAVYLPDADMVVSGHVHERWTVTIPRERITGSGTVYQDNQLHVSIPSYKRENDDGEGWAVEKGLPPKPLGAWWLRLEPVSPRTTAGSQRPMLRPYLEEAS